ncbi:MAG TPA: hypothetical protein VFP84_24520 [Kofleriaceae bacterium]|nr:hypothetical protein [Kofleriaceae bacterium]
MVELLDFGLAKLADRERRTDGTQIGVALGTPMYLSPERARGPDAGVRTDVDALGCSPTSSSSAAYRTPARRPSLPSWPPTCTSAAPPERPVARHPARPRPRPFGLLAKAPASRTILAQLRAVLADLIVPRAASGMPSPAPKPSSRRARPRPSGMLLIAVIALAMLSAPRSPSRSSTGSRRRLARRYPFSTRTGAMIRCRHGV